MNKFLIDAPRQHVNQAALFKHLAPATTIVEAIYLLRDVVQRFGVSDFLYAHMLNEKSFIRNDLIILGTFPKTIRKTFETHGKSAAHAFGDVWTTLDGPYNFDLQKFLIHKNKNNSSRLALDMGYEDTWIFPVPPSHCYGFAGIMAFQSEDENAPVINPALIMKFTNLFHQFLTQNNLIAKHFDLSHKEIDTLRLIAYGKTASDISAKLDISERTVEHRLSMARKKLFASTTAEAVYKTVAYDIFRLSTD